jgi:hypothetical protein
MKTMLALRFLAIILMFKGDENKWLKQHLVTTANALMTQNTQRLAECTVALA